MLIQRIATFFCVLSLSFSFLACKPKTKSNLESTSMSTTNLVSIKGSDVPDLARKSSQPLTIVNIWASWCYPCREEFPALLEFRKKYKDNGVDIHFVSADFASQKGDALEFLASQKIDFETYIKSETDEVFIGAIDRDWKGTLPTTFLFDRSGKLLARWERPLNLKDLEGLVSPFKKS